MGTIYPRRKNPRPHCARFDRNLIRVPVLLAMRSTSAIAVGFVALVLGSPCLGADYYAATTGVDTNVGTFAAPFRTIQKAVDVVGPGDRVLIRGGTYRETVEVDVSGTESNYVEILSYSNETPVVKGSDIVVGWTHHSNSIWKVENWTTGCQQVFVDDALLQRIGYPNSFFATNMNQYVAVGSDSSEMIPGSFFCDTSQNVLYVWLPDSSDPTGHLIEASVRHALLLVKPGHRYIYIDGIRFRHNSSLSFSSFSGAGVSLGENCEMINCRVDSCDFTGVRLRNNARLIDCDVSRNGNTGINWTGSSNVLVSGCTVMSNNVSHFQHSWHAGGMKIIPDGSGIVEDCEVAWNYGNGIWFDTCRSGQLITIRRNYVHDNVPVPWATEKPANGIVLELSKNAFVHDNLVTSNQGGGILIAESEFVRVVNNTISGNTGFAALRGRTTPVLLSSNPDVWAEFANNAVHNNLIVDNYCISDLAFPIDSSIPTNLIHGNTSDYNCVFNSIGFTAYKPVGAPQRYFSLATWTAATGWDSNSLQADPLLQAGGFELSPFSPCADWGRNELWMDTAVDFGGTNRILNQRVDMGCYEVDVADPIIVSITNKVQSVAPGVSAYALMGTNNLNVIGPMVVRNVTLGLEQSFARSGTQWEAPAMGLWDGMTNRLEVFASNSAGVVRHDWVEFSTPNLSTHYVSPGGSHQFPFADWSTAATGIQAAVDAAMPGDTVLVADGLYQTGQRLADGRYTRLVIDSAIEVRSLNGPGAATIQGATGSVRCAYLGAGAQLAGFTLSDGYGGAYVDGGSISNCVASNCSDPGGWGAGINSRFGTVSDCTVEYADGFLGAIYSHGGLVERCELRNNTMTGHGGGIFALEGAIVRNSLIYSNHSNYGGALTLFDSETDACTVENNTKNDRVSGILLRDSTAANCISWSDDSGLFEGYTGSFLYCCLSVPPEPAADGGGNLNEDPQFESGGYTLRYTFPDSPCADQGLNAPWMSGAHDLAGESRIVNGTVDMGCFEVSEPNLPAVVITNKVQSVAPGVSTYALMGTNNLNVTGFLLLSNATRGLDQGFARSGTQWEAPAIGLWDGMTTRLEIYGSNSAGVVRHDWVEISTPNLSTHYVSPGGSHQFPFADWATAATGIQAAVDVAMPGDTVLVADGLYEGGVRLAEGRDTRLVIDKAIEVRSLNGPGAATIQGAAGSVRCAYVGAGAQLVGFTLSDGYGGAYVDGGSISNCVATNCSDPGGWGAGINSRFGTVSDCAVENADGFLGAIYSHGGLVERCELRNNNMTGHGGGIFALEGAIVRSSLIYSNQSNYGGALTLFDSEADACTVENNTKNDRVSGILLRDSTADNCISWSDDSGLYEGYTGSFVRCCLSVPPEPAADGGGNLNEDPQFESGGYTLRYTYPESPCADQGLNAPWMSGALDLAGESRIINGIVDMGCYEMSEPNLPVVIITNKVQSVAPGVSTYALMGTNSINVTGSLVLSNATLGLEQIFVRSGTEWAAPAMGLWDGMTTRLEIFASNTAGVVHHDWVEISTPNLSMHYVSPGGSHQFPFADWATAATGIQAAVDAAMPGDTVLVADGLYQAGESLAQGRDTRLVIDKAIEVRSLNGPGAATIQGAAGSVRCAYVGAGAKLAGFTLSDGYGGAYVDGGSISNCVATNCSDPGGWGAGINSQNGTVSECVVEYANGFHGAIYSGGGLVERCELRHNTMTGHGGGIFAQQGAIVQSSLIYSNYSNYGGALTLFDSEADACTVENNTRIARVSGILLRNSTVANCISWSDDSSLYAGYTGSFVSCCLSALPEPAANGGGNTTIDPSFVANGSGPYRLKPESHCIDAGTIGGQSPALDVTGTLRPQDGDMDGTNTFDIGAYEFNPDAADSDGDSIPDAWETQYGLNPTNALDALEDADGDKLSNLGEYIAGTNPLDPFSYFVVGNAFTTSAEPGFTFTWSSISNRRYAVYRGSELMTDFTIIETGIPTTPPLNVYTDTPPPSSHTWLYCVGVELDP